MTYAASPHFPSHTIETAPAAAGPMLEATVAKFGFLPLPTARHATAPLLVEASHRLLTLFDKASLAPIEREAVVLVVARSFGCDLCRNMHAQLLASYGAARELVDALTEGAPIADARIAALVRFVEATLRHTGGVSDEDLDAFVAAGYTPEQALEVVVGIGAYTLTMFGNRMTRSHSLR
jgi:AhpD family alkylhydroperoxidase